MKYMILLALGFFLFNSDYTYSQTIQVYYKKQVVPNINEIPRWRSSASEKRRYMERMNEKANNEREYFNLWTDGEKSVFRFDTLVNIKKQEDSRWSWWDGNYAHKNYWTINIGKGNCIMRSELLADTICHGTNFNEKFEWKLDKGRRVFCDILCNKAFTVDEKGDTTVAWFARTVPVSVGPENYGGLPGLILALETPGAIYIAESIKKSDKVLNPLLIKPENCLSKEKFREKARSIYYQNKLENEK